ncbi:LysR family transcriptional regulator [Streptosporangium sp. NPDC000396]|uniref:LysR family transcriptional regulator n=1 Tax=Streptosporangium sp. NPDC000396 TaxID=3366185 RepID=UPI0036B450FC
MESYARPVSLELRHLRVLCAISDTGSLTRAATLLGTTQPALSAQLQRVERVIGGRLFERDRHGARPTPLGEFVLTRARTVLSGMDELLAGAAARPAGGPVRLGGIDGPILVGLVDRLGDLLGGREVTSYADAAPRLLCDLVAARRLDAAVVVDYVGHELRPVPPLCHEPVAAEPVFVALASGHPLAGRPELDLSDLAGEAWVLSPPDGGGWPECFRTACHQAGFVPHAPHRAVDAWTIREIVTSGRAVAPCRATFAESDGLVIRPLRGDPLLMRHLLVWHPQGELAAHVPAVRELAARAFADYVRERPRYLEWRNR